MPKKFLVLVLVLVYNYTAGQISTRLTGDWQFLKQDLGGIWEALRPAPAGSPEAVPAWEKIQLPHCVNAKDAVDPDKPYYQGPAWYRKQLVIRNPYANGRTVLHFEGAGQKTLVYINDKKVGEHIGGYDEWSVDITEAITAEPAHIILSIRTDNSRDLEMIPSDLSDFNLYGGIYRYLNLVYLPPLSIENVFATAGVSADLKKATLDVQASFLDPLKIGQAVARLTLLDPTGKIVHRSNTTLLSTSGKQGLGTINVQKPQLWSTDHPQLYTLEITIETGQQQYSRKEKIGFRQLDFLPSGPFHLNGKRLLLKGTHRHEDHAGVGAAMTEEMIRTELLLMKEMGVNFLRLGHYQQSRIVLDLCDSLGILVWEEIPWCRGGLGGDGYQKQAKRMLTNMIEQHYNHASIMVWGLGNENDWPGDFREFDTSSIRSFMKELNALAHRLDPQRKTAIRRCDFCKDIVDVYSPSIWAGWYRGIYTEYKKISQTEAGKVNHFLHVEWGGDSHAGRHAENPDKVLQEVKAGQGADERAGDASLFGGAARVSKDGDWSETYMVNLFDWHLKEQETMPWLTGTAQWVFKDFSTPVRPENPVPYINQKGVLERDFTKKESYYVFQSYWTEKPMVHIYGHSWPVRWGKPGEAKLIKVYSNCTEAELWVNGISVGRKKRNSANFPAAGLRWETILQKGQNTIIANAWKNKTMVSDTIQVYYETEQWGAPAQLSLKKIETSDGSTIIEATLLDAAGRVCLDARNFIRFGITGDGELLDNLGTSSGSRYVQLSNGRAVIKMAGNKEKSVISVQSAGIPTGFLTL
jgi:beta-galactosidase